jgi:hypothetical protein
VDMDTMRIMRWGGLRGIVFVRSRSVGVSVG